jgi:hypothetical protein
MAQISETTNSKINGLPEYLYYGQNERVDELNKRIESRQFPDSPLEPNFSPRPVPTKYALFPIVNRRKELKEPVVPYLEYNGKTNFNPGTQNAPPSGYINNIDIETVLRNQAFALQKSDQSVYVPSSNSDLYKVEVPSTYVEQTHPLLFDRQLYATSNIENARGIGNNVLFNHTRTQLRNSVNMQ